MTKYEWESELKRNIHRLPEDEIRKVVEYYHELFEDKIERGQDERDIISEFGNPVDVADKILSEYDDNNAAANKVKTPYVETETKVYTSKRNTDYQPVVNVETPKASESTSVNPQTEKPKTVTSGKVSGSRLAVFIVFAVLLGGAFFGVSVALWASVGAITVSGFACFGAGLVYIIPTFSLFSSGAASALAQLGTCLIVSGVGAILAILGIKLIKLGAKITKKSFKMMKNFLLVKRSEAYEN